MSIQTINTTNLINNIKNNYSNYPEGSITSREIILNINLDNYNIKDLNLKINFIITQCIFNKISKDKPLIKQKSFKDMFLIKKDNKKELEMLSKDVIKQINSFFNKE